MGTLTEFLTARLDEDEESMRGIEGRACNAGCVLEWHRGEYVWADRLPNHQGLIFDSARVLREVDAKRKILAEHEPLERQGAVAPVICRVCWTAPKDGPLEGDAWPCFTVAALASVYSDHPDYDPEWGAKSNT